MHAGYYKVLCHYSVYIDMHLLVFTRFLCSFEWFAGCKQQCVHSLHVRAVCVCKHNSDRCCLCGNLWAVFAAYIYV